ncbi:MAG: divergent polysaccharide deacetylase family protein [Chitinivibrionales bacterium]
MHRKKLTRLLLFILVLLAAALLVRFIMRSVSISYPLQSMLQEKNTTGELSSLATTKLEEQLIDKLHELEVKKEDIRTHIFLEDTLREIEVQIPRGKPMEWIIWNLSQAVHDTRYQIEDCLYQKRGDFYVLRFNSRNPRNFDVLLSIHMADRYYSNTAQVAIVIQDFNFQANETTTRLLAFPHPLTVCLIAAANKSDLTAQAAHEYDKEIILHLLLESSTRINTPFEESMIMVHYEESRIRDMVTEGPDQIPYFAGFSNLFGSRGCEDSRVMRIVLEEVKKHKAYFLENVTARNSVVHSMSEKMSVPYARIQGTLPADTSGEILEENLKKFCYIAQKKGYYIIGAHANQSLLTALENTLPFFEKNGIQLVHVSTIVPRMRSN